MRYPWLSVEAAEPGSCRTRDSVAAAGWEKTGLLDALSQALAPWRKPLATHDPGKIVFDLAVSVAIGGDCLADIAQLRGCQDVFGPVASDPTVSRLITTLAAGGARVGGDQHRPRYCSRPRLGCGRAAAPTCTALRVGWWWWIWMRAC